MIGLDPGDIMSPEDRERITNTLLHPMIKGNLLNDTVRVNIDKADGTPIWLETVVQPIIKNGELESLLSVSRDISARKAAEEEMEKALLKEKELNTLRSTFISMASHEFRTPLASIKSSVDLLDMYIEEAKPSMQGALGRHLSKVRNQIDRLTDMMNDVLILGKTEAKKMPFEPVKTDVVAFCMDFLEQNFLNRADGRFVKLEVKGKRKKVMLDTGLFSHILSNVLTNAFKYSAGAPNPELTLSFSEEQLFIEVRDYGIGIPEEEQSQLFESFFRAKNAIQLQGTGLGLVIVKEFTQMHGGSVAVKSKQNQGTLVRINLPLKQ
jgi:signal transduction histidine kinase